jgi:hypothetical protein
MKNNYKRLTLEYSVEDLIKANLNLQTTQRLLRTNYKINSASFDSILKIFKNFNSWEEEKRNNFIKLIGGIVNFKKTKKYIEERLQNNEH